MLTNYVIILLLTICNFLWIETAQVAFHSSGPICPHLDLDSNSTQLIDFQIFKNNLYFKIESSHEVGNCICIEFL